MPTVFKCLISMCCCQQAQLPCETLRGHLSALLELCTCVFTVDLQICMKHLKLIFHACELYSLSAFGSVSKRARAARCWPEYAARVLHSINMPGCGSLFNQNINSQKQIFHHYKSWTLASFHAIERQPGSLQCQPVNSTEAQTSGSARGAFPLRPVKRSDPDTDDGLK